MQTFVGDNCKDSSTSGAGKNRNSCSVNLNHPDSQWLPPSSVLSRPSNRYTTDVAMASQLPQRACGVLLLLQEQNELPEQRVARSALSHERRERVRELLYNLECFFSAWISVDQLDLSKR